MDGKKKEMVDLKGKQHRGRDPIGSRPVSEDGLACQAVRERDRAPCVIG